MSQGPLIAHGGKANRATKPVVIGMMAFAVMNFMTVVVCADCPRKRNTALFRFSTMCSPQWCF